MNNEPIPLLAALDKISQELTEHGHQPPLPLPATLSRNRIATMVSIFQTKERDGRWAEDEAHVKNLKGIIGKPDRPTYLDPVTVWWGGQRWYLLDGHRRLAAYRKAKVNSGIPVTVFEGTLDDARAHSVALNSKDQMPMTTADKMNCAWRMVLTTELSKARLADVCGVSNGSIGNVRALKGKLMEELEMTVADLADLTWEQARRRADDGETAKEFDPDEALRKRAEHIRKRLLRAVGNRIAQDPDAFALAVQSIDRRLPGALMETSAWWEPLCETVEKLREDIGEDAEGFLDGIPEEDDTENDY